MKETRRLTSADDREGIPGAQPESLCPLNPSTTGQFRLIGESMPQETDPAVPDEEELITIDSRTFPLLEGVLKALKTEGHAGEPSPEVLFERVSQVGLRTAISRHTPRKPVTGMGGTPAVDWIFAYTQYRSEAKDALEFPMTGVEMGDLEAWIRDLLTPLTLWILDLPASESHHHAYPYGLLDHSLEVALAATTECSSKIGPAYWVGNLSERAYIRAFRQSLVLSFLHDIGKVFNVEVQDKETGELWDPLREPLAYFKARHGLPILEPTPFRFIGGRGLINHEEMGRRLVPLVIHPKIWKRMGPHITQAYDAYLGRYDWPAIGHPAPLDFIADCVHRADGASTARSRWKSTNPGDFLRELYDRVSEEFPA